MTDVPLAFTGERFTPECVREIRYEHWHRYAFARRFVAGKRVLDAACGEGYGSSLLAGVAASVVGVDIDAETVRHARGRYSGAGNLRFEQGDATRLGMPAGAFDVAVSFETLEHVERQRELVAGLARVLADDGLLIVSSPDRHAYRDVAGFENPFHVRELYRDELVDLLRPHFGAIRLYGQKLLFQSAIWSLDPAEGPIGVATAAGEGGTIDPGFRYAPLYFIAVCARRRLPDGLPQADLFGDAEESVYMHYNHEIRKNMAAGARIAELEAEIESLKARGPGHRWRWWRGGRTRG